MNLKEVKNTVDMLGDDVDDEDAHFTEDELYEAILKEVVAGNPEAKEMAKEALKTKTLDFIRWYA